MFGKERIQKLEDKYFELESEIKRLKYKQETDRESLSVATAVINSLLPRLGLYVKDESKGFVRYTVQPIPQNPTCNQSVSSSAK